MGSVRWSEAFGSLSCLACSCIHEEIEGLDEVRSTRPKAPKAVSCSARPSRSTEPHPLKTSCILMSHRLRKIQLPGVYFDALVAC
jgi:hypothetical protein